ncbi:MAG: hypothetical protein HN726_03115 [Candidatus Magasanikbacteria bacterium]|jgi:hypothetical protein|nr:hypothetical protein [Candidatus Magasanikbacteria bacterium]
MDESVQDWVKAAQERSKMAANAVGFGELLLGWSEIFEWANKPSDRRGKLSGWVIGQSLMRVTFEGPWNFSRPESALEGFESTPSEVVPFTGFKSFSTGQDVKTGKERLVFLAADTMVMAQRPPQEGQSSLSFFEVVGVGVHAAGREVHDWVQPMVRRVGNHPGAIVIIRDEEEDLILLRTKVEPGNSNLDGHVVVTSPLHASLANFIQLHGGNKPPYSELFNQKSVTDPLSVQQDGARFLGKQDDCFMIPGRREDMELIEGDRWCTRADILWLAKESLLGQHVICAMMCLLLAEG